MMDSTPSAPATIPAKAQPVLVLQGGGALGSYQAGAYQALCHHDFEPDWIGGISICAANAASIGGHPPARRRLRCPRSSRARSEEHTSELQSHSDLVCRLLLEKKKNHKQYT